MVAKPMRIGITGSSGFIGSHLLRALERLPGVTVTRLLQKHNNELKSLVKDQDLIYHLAGVNRGTGEEILRGNILGTFKLVETVKNHSSARLVFASSAQVYKPGKTGFPIRETSPAEPDSLYGLSKKAAEDLIALSGIDYVVLRLSNVYGPGCRSYYNSVIATLCDRAARKQSLAINGDGRQGRDFIYIDDAVQALVLAGTQPTKGLVFNVSSNRLTSLRQIAGKIKREVSSLKVEYLPDNPGGASYYCDNTRFKKLYKWKPKTSLTEGIRQTLRWFKERNRT